MKTFVYINKDVKHTYNYYYIKTVNFIKPFKLKMINSSRQTRKDILVRVPHLAVLRLLL